MSASPSSWLEAAERGEAELAALRGAAAGCRACPLWRRATQTVFGEGSSEAVLVLVGEQPGDREDREGHPFVGPAGRLLDEALEEAGLSGVPVYVTNAVKHFKWQARGKRRIHERPSANELRACRPWLLAELTTLRPAVVVCLGATAARCVLGPGVKVTRDRGQFLESDVTPLAMPTVHPSSVLRAPDSRARAEARRHFVADLRRVARRLGVKGATARKAARRRR